MPVKRPDMLFLLQPWSTATTQMTKKRMATVARILVSMLTSSATSLASMMRGKKGRPHNRK
jgi:hypothetical protein